MQVNAPQITVCDTDIILFLSSIIKSHPYTNYIITITLFVIISMSFKVQKEYVYPKYQWLCARLQGPLLQLQFDTVTIPLTNGSEAFNETVLPLAKSLVTTSYHSSDTMP